MVESVQIGSTDLYVHPIGLGTNAVGGHNLYPNLNEQAGKDLVKAAIEQGVQLIDTALLYGPYRSEELIGEVIKEMGCRNDVVLATKIGTKFIDGKMKVDNSADFLRSEVDAALRRMQTDQIDLMYLHYPDKVTPKDEAVGVLRDLKKQGKIRAIGLSNFTIEQLKEANKDGYVDVFQGEYNLLNRSAEEQYLPYTRQQKISFIPYFPLASGILAGKYTKEQIFDDLRAKMPHFQGEKYIDTLNKVEQLRVIANEKNEEVANLVLAWYLAQEGIDLLIPGAKRIEQVERNIRAAKIQLTTIEREKISRIFD